MGSVGFGGGGGGPEGSSTYTFDPIFVEDPLASGNNVLRNAFRITQVLRSFSDAYRTLVANLEFTSEEGDDDGALPLLNCLLKNEDFFEFS